MPTSSPVFPSLSRIRQVSAKIALEAAAIAYERGLADRERPENILEHIRDYMVQPVYPRSA